MNHTFFQNDAHRQHKAFAKYHGNGNDFIIFDALKGPSLLWLVKNAGILCDRHRGIGADGIISLSLQEDCFHMSVINADGTLAKNCGNGLRCAALHIFKTLGIAKSKIELFERIFFCTYQDGKISVEMGDCQVTPSDDLVHKLGPVKTAMVAMGNQHQVLFFPEPVYQYDSVVSDIISHRDHEDNIGFVFEQGSGSFFSMVYERGVGFTNSCGSGACAAACFLAVLFPEKISQEMVITQPGGELKIKVALKNRSSTSTTFTVLQVGEAEEVFTGIC
ncbi:MAG TPA: diaminopimelate epimerase [Myxococcota bacterium]|nr:diaminopimelate epimerase [Myxococcota bacterium]